MTKFKHKGNRRGFTLMELLIALAIIGLLMAVAMPSYQDYVDDADIAMAGKDIAMLDQAIEVYIVDTNTLPLSLAEVGYGGRLDPWDNPYQYLPFDEDTNQGQMRKDKNLVPVNDDYDLYSMGKNGTTSMPFSSAGGKDDIVRANNGRYIGLADDY